MTGCNPHIASELPADGQHKSPWQEAHGRDIAALLNPRPVLVISAESHDAYGFATVLWAMPISHNPSMMALALRERSHTMGLIKESGAFCINVLPANEEGIELAAICGTQSGHTVDKSTLLAWRREVLACAENAEDAPSAPSSSSDSDYLSLPILESATSWVACTVERIEEAGDHLLVIGRVARALTQETRTPQGLFAPTDSLLCAQHGTYAEAYPIQH